MERITSRKNPLLEHMRRLDSAAFRRQQGEFLCDSPKLVEEALRHGARVLAVAVSDGVEPPEGLDASVRCAAVPPDVMASISPMRTPQGMLAVCRLPDTALPEMLPGSRYVVLDGVQDPGNVGTVLRTADAFGCDGVLLLVDAFEGTMPQTRFVLQKALSLGKKPIVVINKVDKPNCRPEVVNEQVFDLMFSLNATEEQLDYKTIYGSAKQGWMSHKWNEPTNSIVPLLDAIIDEIPEPVVAEGTPQLLITSLEYSPYTGRIAVGKLTRGTLRAGQNVTLAKRDGVTMQKTKIRELMVFEGLGKKKVDEVPCGEICAVTGIDGFEIGDTICDFENPEPLPPIAIDEPTMSMLFTINNSPFFGKDGKFVTSRHIKERLDRELEKNLALRVTPGPSADSFNVFGRGVLHLSVLIETMRREGYELQVGQPRVIVKEIEKIVK